MTDNIEWKTLIDFKKEWTLSNSWNQKFNDQLRFEASDTCNLSNAYYDPKNLGLGFGIKAIYTL